VEKTAKKFRSFAEAEKADRDFYKKLTGNERLQILVELLNHGLSKDWREFLELLNSRGVDYVIVGAHSLALHGRPRYTGDRDVLVRSTPENARLLVDILNEFGFAESGFQELDFLKAEQLIQLGRAPTRIALLTSITGVSNEEAFASKVSAELDRIPVFVLGKDALVRNKRAVGLPQDLADIDMLES
jgi:hypothetical protein